MFSMEVSSGGRVNCLKNEKEDLYKTKEGLVNFIGANYKYVYFVIIHYKFVYFLGL